MKLARVDKKKKTLTMRSEGICHCCACYFLKQRIYDLDKVKNVKIQVTYKDVL